MDLKLESVLFLLLANFYSYHQNLFSLNYIFKVFEVKISLFLVIGKQIILTIKIYLVQIVFH